MIKKSVKKQAMSLMALLVTMSVIMITLAAAAPIITKRMQQITTGRASSGMTNLNTSKGYWICYRGADNRLHQTRVDIMPNGDTQFGAQNGIVGSCNFSIPSRAENFKITAIGGGGGGAGTTVQQTSETVGRDSITFGLDRTVIRLPFADFKNVISEGNVELAMQYLFSLLSIEIRGSRSIAVSGNKNGNGAACLFPVGGDFFRQGNILNYRPSAALGEDGVLTVINGGTTTTYTACAGRSIPCYSYTIHETTQTCAEYRSNTVCADNLGAGNCLRNGTLDNSYHSEPVTSKNTTSAKFVFKEGTSVLQTIAVGETLPLSLQRNLIQSIQGKGGSAGEVVTREVPSLGTDSITIQGASIGTGGAGGAIGTVGSAGGATAITLQGITITAQGGAGGTIENTRTISSAGGARNIARQEITGEDGKKANYVIPAKLNIVGLQEGIGAPWCTNSNNEETCRNQSTRNYNARSAATLPGAGGGSGASVFEVTNGAETTIHALSNNRQIGNSTTNDKAVTSNWTHEGGTGSNGGGGAVIIQW